MDEQDSDFKELWANILSRAKKKAGDAETAKRAPNRSKSTTARGKLRRGKAAGKSQTHQHLPAVKETNLPRDLGPEEQTCETAHGDGRRSPFPLSQLSTGTTECSQRPLTGNTLSGCSQTTLPSLPAAQLGTCSSPTSKVRVAELVVERMQQFKRVAPEQLKLGMDGSLPKAAASGEFPDGSQEQNPPENDTYHLPSVEHDGALALALEQESKEEALASLEDAGLFFCQICQKDLSAMNMLRREQHVNRCLDEMEEAQMSSSSKPVVPECPICGKQFQTPQSRLSHLKRCAVEMDVPPNLLLQAVQLQVSTLGDAPLQCPSNQPSRAKRKGFSDEDSKKTQKRAKIEPKDEDLQVAMAMSRSLLEQEKQEQAKSVTNVKPMAAFPIKWKPGSEKKRRKRGPAAPPPLLLQDPEKARRRIQERVALLLAEEVEFPPTPQLPVSRILEDESGKAAWLLPLSKAKECFLWKISALTGPCDSESFYTAALIPPVVPWKPLQNDKPENVPPSVGSHQPEVSQEVQPRLSSQEPTCAEFGGQTGDESKPGLEGDGQFFFPSQKDVQTLEDLVELAREGLTLTQWNLDAGHVQAAEQPGEELSPSDPPQSGFVPPSKGKNLLSSSSTKRSSLRLLAEDFGAMVNNPHLSDVQFQVDSGEVLYAHLFVLYARCPQAAQAVHSQGFVVEEDGTAPTRRVLLSDVPAEAVGAFLRYLYAADTHVPVGLQPQLRALAARFGVRELMAECENDTGESQVPSGVDSEDDLLSVRDDKDCEDRAENFQDLLKSVWVGEDEEEGAMLTPECQKEGDSGVSDQELEEIYEFAATQRKMARSEGEVSKGIGCSTCSDTETAQGANQQPGEEEVKRPESASISSNFRVLRDGSDVEGSKHDSSAQEEEMQNTNRCKNMNHPQTTVVPHHCEPQKWDGASHGANEGKAVHGCGDVEDSTSSWVSHAKADHCEKEFPGFQGATDINDSYECLFSASQGDHCEPSPMEGVIKESGKSPSEKHVDLNDSLLFSKSQNDHSPCRDGFCGTPTPKPCVPLFPAVGSSPASPKLEGKFSREHVSTPKQSKKEESLLCDEIHSQKAKELDAASRSEDIVSPAGLPHSDLNQHAHVPVWSSPGRTQDAAAQGSRKGDVIVLSSDDEMELRQDKSPESSPAPKKMEIPGQLVCTDIEQGPEVPKPGQNSSVPNAEQRSAQVSCGITDTVDVSKDVKVSPELPLSGQTVSCTEGKQSPNPSPGKRLSHEMSSGTDSSWVVPGTPVLSRNRSFSTQTDVTSINSLKSPRSKLRMKNLAVGNSNHEMTGNLKTVNGTALSDKHFPVESSVTERSPSSSPAAGSLSKSSPPVSPVDPVLLSPGHTNTRSKCASIPGLSKPLLPCQEQPLGDKTNVSVVEVEDSLPSLGSSVLLCEEPPVPTDDCWHVECLSPVRGDSQDSGQVSCAETSTGSSPGSCQDQWESPVHTQGIKGSTPLQGSPAGRRTALLCPEKSPIEACSSLGSRPSYLNSKIWDDWNGEEKEDEFPEILPLSQRLAGAAGSCQIDPVKTPESSCQEKDRSPSTPVTPMPAYSIMETPQLKKELSRFGVRALPKRQMVLKLKEIFQYTHRDVDSDFEDEIPYSQPLPQNPPAKRPRQPKAGRAGGGKGAGASRAVGRRKQLATASSGLPVDKADDGSHGKGCAASKEGTKVTHHPEGAKEQKTASVSPEKGSLAADGEEPMLSASQESAASSVDGSDISFGSQSSFVNGFEACDFASEEEEEEFSASQAAAREEEKLEAVRCYIRSNTALYNRILFYEPLELADLHAELKQNGIKISKAKLLDFLDDQCITCTMARARKEQVQKRKENKNQRRRYRVKPIPS